MSNEALPPLPSLEGRGSHLCDQETLERVIRLAYERRPDLIKNIREREVLGEDPGNKTKEELREFIYEEARISNSVMPGDISFEIRRCVRHMYGLPDSFIPEVHISRGEATT